MSETSSEIEDKSGRNDCEISDVMIGEQILADTTV